MGYVKSLKPIKRTPGKALDYIENLEKTMEGALVSGYNVDPLTASVEFALTRERAKQVKGDRARVGGSNNLAYHYVQSFSPKDAERGMTPELAHEIGKRWADEILGGKYEYVIATHVDKGAIHNHVIFNATSFLDFKKWNNRRVIGRMMEADQRLCAEYGLCVREKAYQRKPIPFKEQMKPLIDQALEDCSDYSSFVAELKKVGIEIKQSKRGALSFRYGEIGQDKFTRGDTIGPRYTSWEALDKWRTEKEDVPVTEAYTRQLQQRARRSAAWKETRSLVSALMTIRQEGIAQDEDFAPTITALESRRDGIKETIQQLQKKTWQYEAAAKCLFELQTHPDAAGKIHDYAVDQLRRMKVDPNVDPEKVIQAAQQIKGQIREAEDNLGEMERRIEALKRAQKAVLEVRGTTRQQSKNGQEPR